MNGPHTRVTPSAHEINRRVREIERGQEPRGYPSPGMPAVPEGNNSPTDRNDGHSSDRVFGAISTAIFGGVFGGIHGGVGGAVVCAIVGMVIGAVLGRFIVGGVGGDHGEEADGGDWG